MKIDEGYVLTVEMWLDCEAGGVIGVFDNLEEAYECYVEMKSGEDFELGLIEIRQMNSWFSAKELTGFGYPTAKAAISLEFLEEELHNIIYLMKEETNES